jgi:hypothetical protein
LAAVLGIALVLSGCSDPRFKQKQAIRDARIKHYLDDYAAHDAAGVDRMRQTVDLDRTLAEWRAENLTRTCGLVRTLHERDVRRWKEEEPLRKARIEALLRGKPDEIDDTYAKMVY